MSGLTFTCQAHAPGVAVFVGGEQQPGCCRAAGRREGTSRVSITVEPLFIKASVGAAHLGSSQTDQPRYLRSPLFRHRFQGYSTYLDTVTKATWWMCLVLPNLWVSWVYFRYQHELSSYRPVCVCRTRPSEVPSPITISINRLQHF